MSNPDKGAGTIDVKALANLARVAVSDAELAALEAEFPALLNFVNQIQAVGAELVKAPGVLRNVMRTDANPHETGAYTEDLLNAAPAVKDGRVQVKQVIKRH